MWKTSSGLIEHIWIYIYIKCFNVSSGFYFFFCLKPGFYHFTDDVAAYTVCAGGNGGSDLRRLGADWWVSMYVCLSFCFNIFFSHCFCFCYQKITKKDLWTLSWLRHVNFFLTEIILSFVAKISMKCALRVSGLLSNHLLCSKTAVYIRSYCCRDRLIKAVNIIAM